MGGRSELYDVVGDRAGGRDVSAEHPELTKELRDELAAWQRQVMQNHRLIS